MPYKDKEKQKAYWRDWRARNREKDNARISLRKRKIRRWFREYKKNLKCNRCPENHQSCLVFHHPGKKDIEVSNLVGRGYSKERILIEISVCEVLCYNCHRKEHWNDVIKSN